MFTLLAEAVEKTPHMLHMVYKIKKLKGRPWWERNVAEKFGLGEREPVSNQSSKLKIRKHAQLTKYMNTVMLECCLI